MILEVLIYIMINVLMIIKNLKNVMLKKHIVVLLCKIIHVKLLI